MVERNDRASVTTLYVEDPLSEGSTVRLDGSADHIRARRLRADDPVRLTNGVGVMAAGRLSQGHRGSWQVEIEGSETVQREAGIRFFAPVADRARLLWLAEKACEVGIETWSLVRFARSSSVAARGEGAGFQAKVRARMISALEQGGQAWLPRIEPDVRVEELRLARGASGFVLDPGARGLASLLPSARQPWSILVGPEGGLETDEVESLKTNGWQPTSLGPRILRFETAGIAALALASAARSIQEE